MGNQRQLTNVLKTADKAWAAGFLDGEGCIRIRQLPTPKRRITKVFFGLWVGAAQVDRTPLEKLQQLFGGAINLHNRPTSRPNAAPYYTWLVTGHTAAAALKAMLPYLTVKRERAILGLEFQQHTGRKRGGCRLLTSAEMELRETYAVRMRYLNLGLVARRRAAETKSESLLPTGAGSDSPVCTDDKCAEAGGNIQPLRRVV